MADTFARKIRGALTWNFYALAPGRLHYTLHKRRFLPNIQAWEDAPCFMLHVPKCGGKSVAASLNLPDPGHTILTDMPRSLQETLAKKPCIFVVRDPIDRIVSTFKYAHRHIAEGRNRTFAGLINSKDINDFIQQKLSSRLLETRHFFREASSFYDAAVSLGMKPELVNFRSLDAGCRQFFLRHEIHVRSIPRINVTKERSDLNLTLTRSSKLIVLDLYSRDIELYAQARSEN